MGVVKPLLASLLTLITLLSLHLTRTPEEINDTLADSGLCRMSCGRWKKNNFTNFQSRGMGTCSATASARGSNQSVIAFTFCGQIESARQYFKGIEGNIELLSKLYPGYVVRVYHNLIDPYAVSRLCEVYCEYKHVMDLCYVGDIPGFGNLLATHQYMWRFMPLVDPQVEIFLSRDLDSRFSEREVAAVQEWLQSGRPLHVMRDHPAHVEAILGGMWGARVQERFTEWREVFDEMMKRLQNTGAYNQDQIVLREVMFEKLATKPGFLLAHDSYHCRDEKFLRGEIRPFPTERRNEAVNFVGSIATVHTGPMMAECPLPCRKKPEWKYC